MGDVDGARSHVTALVLDRRYRAAPVRWAGNPGGERVVRIVESGRVCKLSAAAGVLLDNLDGATGADAAAALAALHPGVEHDRIERDTIATIRWLLDRGVIVPAPGAPEPLEGAALTAHA
jgi:hypothetical protein